jgi:hypothetical protein
MSPSSSAAIAKIRSTASWRARHVLAELRAMARVEAYVTFKSDLIDEKAILTDAGTRRFLQFIIDQSAGLAAQLTTTPKVYTIAV